METRTLPVTAPAATRRYVVLSFLLWLPVGLMMAPLVLLVLERGFTLADVAILGVVSSVAVALLELPTGGLADALGRRPVLVVSALVHALGLVLLGLGATLTLLLASAALRGLARALSTGPLEAWYIDALQASSADPASDGPDPQVPPLTTGLARGEVAASVALAVGTLAGGVLPQVGVLVDLPFPALAVPVLVAAVVEVVRAGLTVGLPESQRRRATTRQLLADVPRTVRTGVAVGVRDRVVLRLMMVAGATGVALASLELVMPGWLDVVVTDPRRAALLYAAIVTAGFLADALGGALAPRLRRWRGDAWGAAVVATLAAVLAAVALAAGSLLPGAVAIGVAAVAYLGIFVGLGAAGPALGELLHGRVRGHERATVLSVQSLMLQLTGAGGVVVAGWLVVQQGPVAGFLVGGTGLLMSLVLVLRGQHRS
jgi:MFS family permease